MATAETEITAERSGGKLRRVLIVLGAILGLGVLYYIVGAVWVHEIDDDPAFDESLITAPPPP